VPVVNVVFVPYESMSHHLGHSLHFFSWAGERLHTKRVLFVFFKYYVFGVDYFEVFEVTTVIDVIVGEQTVTLVFVIDSSMLVVSAHQNVVVFLLEALELVC
jgi:hypothetical protein